MLRLDGYVRVSKVGGRQGEGFISPQVQGEGLEKWAASRDDVRLTLQPAELDVSGGTMTRPVFDTIMGRIESGEADGLVVFKVDRFARSVLGALETLQTIAKAGGTFASVSDNVDMTTAQGRAFLQMQLVFAELFREQIREGFAVSTERAVMRGVHISAVPPVGYDRVDQRLVPNDAAPVITELFERRAAGEGASSLARFLDEALPKPGGQMWTPGHVSGLLSMRAYRGEAHYGEHSNPRAHEAIVSPETFARAAASNGESPRLGGKTHLLAGIIRCAGCRYMMTPSMSGPAGSKVLVYRCRGKHTAGRCSAPATINRAIIEAYVQSVVLASFAGGAVSLVEASEALEAASREAEALRAELATFAADATARGILGDEAYYSALQARSDAVRAAEDTLEAAQGAAPTLAIEPHEWAEFTVSERRSVLATMLDAVMVRKMPGKPAVAARTFLAFRGAWEGNSDLPKRGKDNGPVRGFEWREDDCASAGVPTL